MKCLISSRRKVLSRHLETLIYPKAFCRSALNWLPFSLNYTMENKSRSPLSPPLQTHLFLDLQANCKLLRKANNCDFFTDRLRHESQFLAKKIVRY